MDEPWRCEIQSQKDKYLRFHLHEVSKLSKIRRNKMQGLRGGQNGELFNGSCFSFIRWDISIDLFYNVNRINTTELYT